MKKGFTLIELLVIISIISLLSSVVLATLKDAKNKANTSKITQEIIQLKNALELYRSDYGKYPNDINNLVPKYISVIPNITTPLNPGYPSIQYSGGTEMDKFYSENGYEIYHTCGTQIVKEYVFGFWNTEINNFPKWGYIRPLVALTYFYDTPYYHPEEYFWYCFGV